MPKGRRPLDALPLTDDLETHMAAVPPRAAGRATPIPRQRTAPGGPSSLVKVPAGSSPQCPACGSARLTSITMTLTDGTPVRFCNCRACEHRSWQDGTGVLDVASVLARTTKPR